MGPSEEKEVFPLLKAVFENDLKRLSSLLSCHDADEKDQFGNTALHIASMLGRKDCVNILLMHGASIMMKNASGWTPLAEAVSYGDRQLIKLLLKRLKVQNRETLESRRPQLVETLTKLDDFILEVKWEFHSWVPFLSKYLPSDTCVIKKRGCNIRMDSTLIEFTDMKWHRGDISFIFNGATKGPKALVVLDNKKKVFQKLRHEDTEDDLEEEIDYLMSSDIVAAQMSTKTISFQRSLSGWIFKEDKTEYIGLYKCDVYTVNGMTLISRKRREHLTEEDVQKNKAVHEAFQKGDHDAIEKLDQVERRKSLKPPSECTCSWEEYSSQDDNRPPHLGRKMIIKEDRKSVKVAVWMSGDFPLDVNLLLSVLEVIAPSKHFEKLKEFISMKLPTGFPVKIEIPVLPTISAKITFQGFEWCSELPESLFYIPEDFKEDPHHFPDL
ncbi:ankyrin repeat domain-containing protein 13C-B-like [Rhopilema esculentum]|uniref:ankyrin repeat domain-containing protein 13C-B-like n=1 Tax=Rhopilema esculentum TaxID=499914 RepID=UPI0031D79D5A